MWIFNPLLLYELSIPVVHYRVKYYDAGLYMIMLRVLIFEFMNLITVNKVFISRINVY